MKALCKMQGAFFMPKIKQLAIKSSYSQVTEALQRNGYRGFLQLIASKNQVKKQLFGNSEWLLF